MSTTINPGPSLAGPVLSGRDLLGVARLRVQQREPYFTTALFSLRVMEVPGYGTIGVDEGFRLVFDPCVAEKWGLNDLTTVVAHEIRHPLLLHPKRERELLASSIGSEIRALWRQIAVLFEKRGYPLPGQPTERAQHLLCNILQDCEINSGMEQAGWHMPDHATLPQKLGLPQGELFESYAVAVVNAAKKLAQQEGGQGGTQKGTDKRDGEQQRAGGQSGAGTGERENQQQQGSGADGAEQPQGRGGEGGAGEPRPEDGDGGPGGDALGEGDGGAGEGEPAGRPGCGGDCGIGKALEEALREAGIDPLTRGEGDIVRRVVASAIESNTKGTVPAHLRKWAQEQLAPPKVTWEQELRAVVRGAITDAAGAGDFSYRRPGRRTPGVERFTGRSMILPALRQPIPQVGIVLDTSGSMGSGRGSRIEQALSEVIGIVRAMRCPVKVWSTDAAVATVTRVMPDTDISKLTEGGGGTDMRIGITEAAKDRLDIIVVLTDAITDWPTPKEMPKQRLIAAVVGKHPVPEHIRTIRIPKK